MSGGSEAQAPAYGAVTRRRAEVMLRNDPNARRARAIGAVVPA
jgi:hypothetical protein